MSRPDLKAIKASVTQAGMLGVSRKDLASLIAYAERLEAALEKAETFIADDTCRHDYEKAPVLFVIRAALEGK